MRRLPGAIPTVLLLTGLLAGFDDTPAVPLFDGKSLEGWTAEHAEGFSANEGVLASKAGPGWLRSAGSYKNFQLDLQYRILKEGSEGGLLVRAGTESSAAEPHWPARGYQVPITDGDGGLMLFGHGTAPPRFERKAEALKATSKPPGNWQKLTLTASGTHIEIRLDDVLVTVADGVEVTPGHIGLYDKTGRFEWKDITIRVQPD